MKVKTWNSLGFDARPELIDITNDSSRRRADLQRLETAREAASGASQRPVEMNHFSVSVVLDDHVKWSGWSTGYSCATICVLHGFVHILQTKSFSHW